LRLLRLGTISSLVSITSRSNAGAEPILSITAAYILVLLFMMMFAINFAACIALFIAYIEGLENSWMAAFQIADGGWINLPTATQPQQWYTAVYWVITTASTTGYGDITPRSYVEQVLASMFMIFGLLFFGLLIGMRPRPLHASGAQTSCQPCCSAECNTLACAHCVLACCPGMHGCEANTLEHAISSLLAAAACAALSASHAPPPALPRPAVPPDMYTVAQAPLPTRQLARPAERKSCTYFARRLAGF